LGMLGAFEELRCTSAADVVAFMLAAGPDHLAPVMCVLSLRGALVLDTRLPLGREHYI